MISLNKINLQFGDRIIFNDVSFLINNRDRIGLVGNNGAGKSTLLKLILGNQPPGSGNVQKPSDISFGYLPQQMKHVNNKTVFEEVKDAFSIILNVEKKLEKLNNELSQREDYDSDEYFKILNKVNDYNTRLQLLGNTNIDEQVEKTLAGLGFLQSDLKRNTGEFSGGWRMRIELAKILLQYPNILLLDEPTNHLDIESIQWMEQLLKDYPGAVVIISHDRTFLNTVTNRTIEIALGKINDYKVPFSEYEKLRKERKEQQLAAYRNQQKLIEDTERFIERFRYKNTKAVQVQSRIKQLEKLERIEIEEEDNSKIAIKFPDAPRSGTIVVEVENLTKNYGDIKVLNNVNLIVERGERIAFVGRNGEGKTTMSKVLMNEIEYEGTYKSGHNVKVGYFAQNQDELLDENITVFDTIDRVAVGDIRTKIRGLLGAFLFSGDDIDKKVKVLSGGERSRLALIKLLLEPYNLLLLDEPTNHLDMRSKDILKQALSDFNGTLIVVSHDREFLDGLVDKIYEFKNKRIKEYIGNIYEYIKKKNQGNISNIRPITNSKADDDSSLSKYQYLERKEINRTINKIQNQIKKCESNIEGIENEMKLINSKLSDPDLNHENLKNQSLYSNYHNLEKKLEDEMNRWERLNTELEEWKQKIN